MDNKKIADLVARIRDANRRYYDEDNPNISDVEYDELKASLEKLASDHPVLNEIGNPTFGDKFTHKTLMGSLTKCHTVEEIIQKFAGQNVTYMPKIDGCSLALHYSHGVLQTAVTRGDGKIGEVVTANAVQILNIPTKISCEDNIEIRGEAYIAKGDFYGIMDQPGYAGHEQGLANPRNAAAGGLRQKDPKMTAERKIQFVAYNVLGSNIFQHDTKLDFLDDQGFETVISWSHVVQDTRHETGTIDAIKSFGCRYDIDGVVVMITDEEQFEGLGYSGKCPKGALAFKFETEKKPAVVKDIIWQTGRTGKVTPVAVIDPTHICGSTVSRISLHSYGWMKEKDIAIGDKILFEKANEIIPEVVEVLEREEARLKGTALCSSCAGAIIEKGADLVCENPSCPAQFLQHTRFILETLNIKGIALKTLEKMADAGILNNPWDVFDISEASLVEIGFGKVESTKMVQAVSNVETTPARLLTCLGIPGWGETMFEKLFEKNQIHGNDWVARVAALEAIDCGAGAVKAEALKLGPIRADVLTYGLNKKLVLLNELLNRIKLTSASKEGLLAGSTFCITGTLSKPRKQIQQDIKNAGGVVKDSITKALDYLVLGEGAGSKLQKAQDAGVMVISEQELYSMIGG